VGGKYAGSVEGTDEEPLLFPMSEFERELRRSLEEERRGGSGSGSGSRSRSVSVGVGVGEATRRAGGVARGGGVEGGDDDHFEPRGIQRKGW
jgi:autophagy-related protein 13